MRRRPLQPNKVVETWKAMTELQRTGKITARRDEARRRCQMIVFSVYISIKKCLKNTHFDGKNELISIKTVSNRQHLLLETKMIVLQVIDRRRLRYATLAGIQRVFYNA